MKIDRKTLLAELQFVGRVASERAAHPILSHVLWRGEEGLLAFTATDGEMVMVESSLAGEIETPFALAVPLVAADLLGSMTEGEVEVEIDAEEWRATDSATKLRLSALAGEEFPRIAEPEAPEVSTVAAGELMAAIRAVRHAAQVERALANLPTPGGLAVHLPTGTAIAVSNHRLAVSGQLDGWEPAALLKIPPPALKALEELPSDADWELSRGEYSCSVRVGARRVTFRYAEGGFPDAKSVIRRSVHPNTLTVNRAAFSAAAETASRCPGVENRSVILDLDPEAGHVIVRGRSPVGEVRSRVEATIVGPGCSIGAGAEYLIEMLDSIPGKEVTIRYDIDKPLYYEGEGDQRREYRVIAPRKV